MCGFLWPASARAQTINGAVSGQVTDEAGAAVPGATVTVTNAGTNATREAVTNEEGLYRIVGLPVGTYSVKAAKDTFAPQAVEQLDISVGVDATANFKLGAGAVQETVEVVASSGALLETVQSQVTKTVDQTRILELPGRNSLNGLALGQPGVLPNAQGRPGSGFVVNGNRTRSNNFTIDGANNNDQSLSTPRQNLPPEALQEFQIITNTFAAEFGRNAGSYINQITRSGTNEFHGAGFYTWQGNGYDALRTNEQRAFTANKAAGLDDYRALRAARGVTVDHVYGGTIGGPVVKDHTFFFTSYDARNLRQTANPTRIALSPQGLATLQSLSGQFAPGALNFLTSNFPVANDPTAQGSVTLRNPITNAVLGTIPFQTFNRARAAGTPLSYRFDTKRWLMKVNTQLNDKDQLSFRYLINNGEDPGTPSSLPGQEVGTFNLDQSMTINDVYTLTSNLINEARFTYSRRTITYPENLGIAFSVSGLSNAFTNGNANFPQGRVDNVYEFTDNVSYLTGKHNFKFGYNLLDYQLNSFFAPNFRGTVNYPSLGEFLFDRNASLQRYAGNGLTEATTYEHGFFAQDDWRVSPDLTLNLGLRYEYVTAPLGYFSNAKADINNFGPSVGFAYNPKGFADGRFVARGGFRISYDQVFQNILLNNSRNFPRGVNIALSGLNGTTPYIALPPAPSPEDFVRLGGNPNFLPLRLFSPDKRISQPQSRQFTLGVQYQFANDLVFKADYIATQGRNLVRELESNLGFYAPLGTVPAGATNPAVINAGRPDPTRGSILIGDGYASSVYHGGQFSVERRLSDINFFGFDFGSITLNANYTYSAFISTADDVLGGQANRTLPADPRNPDLDRARSGFDQPHRFVASYVLVGPDLFRENAILNRVFGGWEITGITTSASGTPFSVLSANNSLGILPGQISTVELSQRVGINPNGAPRTFTSANAQGVPTDPAARYILYPSFSGILAQLGANTERTGTTNNTDFAGVKNIRTFGETQRLQLRVEVFNAFNHRNFTLVPANTLSATTNPDLFLNLGRTDVGGRGFTFGARYFF